MSKLELVYIELREPRKISSVSEDKIECGGRLALLKPVEVWGKCGDAGKYLGRKVRAVYLILEGEKPRPNMITRGMCQSDRDGYCKWSECPQLRDGEPEKSGRHCPLDLEEPDF